MTEISCNKIITTNDSALIESLGSFIKYHRLLQNKSQGQLAMESGIARSTLSLFERGENTSLVVFIQLLRTLDQIHQLQVFEILLQTNPIETIKLKQNKRSRARRKNVIELKPKLDWCFY